MCRDASCSGTVLDKGLGEGSSAFVVVPRRGLVGFAFERELKAGLGAQMAAEFTAIQLWFLVRLE